MSLKVTGVYFSASSAGPGPGKMKATIRAARHHAPPPPQPVLYHHHQHHHHRNHANNHHHPNAPLDSPQSPTSKSSAKSRFILSSSNRSHSQSLDYLHLNFEEKRQIIASSLSLVDFLHHPPVKVKGKRGCGETPSEKKGVLIAQGS